MSDALRIVLHKHKDTCHMPHAGQEAPWAVLVFELKHRTKTLGLRNLRREFGV
jgi:hypothetical protein